MTEINIDDSTAQSNRRRNKELLLKQMQTNMEQLYSQCTSTRMLTLVLPTALNTWHDTGSVKKEWSAVVMKTLSLAPSRIMPPFAHLKGHKFQPLKNVCQAVLVSILFYILLWPALDHINVLLIFLVSKKINKTKFRWKKKFFVSSFSCWRPVVLVLWWWNLSCVCVHYAGWFW